jgi:putative aldouronate transport system substrate-binding protein
VFAPISTGSRGPEDGLMTRMNWFEDQGLEIPTTFDEATEVLKALSVAYDLKDPLYMTGDGILDNDQLSASFGVALKFDSISGEGGFYIGEDGRVHFGYCEQGFIDYIQQMKDWYDAGIISKDFTSNPTDYKNEDLIDEIMAGETAIFSRGDGLMDLFRAVSGDDIQAIPDFVVNEGDTIHLGNAELVASGTTGAVITTGCEEPELAMQFLNWWYTEDGQRASIYGIEGVSYYIDDNGDPQYTEMMTSTEGQTLTSMRLDYCGILELRPDGLTPEASYSAEAQEAPVIWGSNKDGLYEIPDGVTPTVDEGDDFSKYFSDISTYCQEMTCKFITGAVDMSEIEAFQSELKNMGVQECCAIYEDAIARYNAR